MFENAEEMKMNLTLKLLAASAALSLAALSMSGCGNDCATGTKESDGQCIPDTTTCGAGTTLVNGKCQLDATGCGEGSSLDDSGKCVADPFTGEECGEGTTFDAGTSTCVPVEIIECGPNTTKTDGKCVPNDGVCAANTKLGTDGQCVVDAPACGAGTQLDPNTAKCAVTDQVCGANTAFDAATSSCKTTNSVCDAGTVFSPDTGLCLPEATCRMGDVIVDGKCSTSAQALAETATVTSTENDDPRFGGTANTLTIPAMQGQAVVAKGTINIPVDLDADGTPDQDYDFYTIQGTAGQHISVDLAVIGGPSMSVALIGPDGPEEYIRFSGVGAKRGASRSFLLPKDGDYSLVVVPTVSLLQGEDAGPFGEDGWDYVLSVSNIAAPVAVDADPATGSITGSFANLSDNLYKLTNVAPGTIVDVKVESVGDNVEGYVQLWNGPSQFVREYAAVAGDTYRVALPSMGDSYLFFDWAAANGNKLGYEVSVTPLPNQENLGAIPAAGTATSSAGTYASGDVRYITYTAAAGEIVELINTNDENVSVDIEVRDASGAVVFSDTSFAAQGSTSSERAYIYAPAGGTFVITSEANAAATNSTIGIKSLTPADAGAFMAGQQIAITSTTDMGREQRELHKVSFATPVRLTGALTGGAGETLGDLWFHDAATGAMVANLTTTTAVNQILPAGDYLISVEANLGTLPMGYSLSLDVVDPPAQEIEPNNDQMTATPWTNLSAGILGTTYSIESAAQGDPDYFALTIANDGVYTFNATSSSFCFETTLLNAGGDSLFHSETETYTRTIYLTAGTYTLINTGWCSSTQEVIDYEYYAQADMIMANAQDSISNDTAATAQDLTMVAFPLAIAGGIQAAADEDWYKINVATAGTYDFALRNVGTAPALHAGLTAQFFDATGTTEYPKTGLSVDLPAGDVLVKLSGFLANGGNSYALNLRPAPIRYNFADTPALAIPDNTAAGVTTTLAVAPPMMPCLIDEITVDMDITHTWRGDVILDLTSPSGTIVRLHNKSGGSADNITGNYNTTLTSAQPLSGFVGEDPNGTWTLFASDTGNGDTGTINSWGLNIVCQ